MKFNFLVSVGGTYLHLYRQHPQTYKIRSTTHLKRPLHLASTLKRLIKKNSPHSASISIGMRGVWTPAERKRWTKILSSKKIPVYVESDIELALRLYFGDKPGAVLNAGTGSIALLRQSNGRLIRTGGLGPLVGDEGSAFWIGKEYLKRQGTDWKKLRQWAKHPEGITRVAAVSKKVLRLANNKDQTAQQVVREAIDHLCLLLNDLANKNSNKKALLVLDGGLFQSHWFRRVFCSRIRRLPFRVRPT